MLYQLISQAILQTAIPTAQTDPVTQNVALAKDILAALQSLATIVAFIVGAVWFSRRRQTQARSNITHRVYSWPVSYGMIFLRVVLSLENRGNVKMRMSTGWIRVFQLLPLPPNIDQALLQALDPVEPDRQRATWYKLKEKNIKWNPDTDYIEPNETAEYHYDFFVDGTTQVMQIRSYVVDRPIRQFSISWKKQPPWIRFSVIKTPIGWQTISVYDLKTRKNELDASKVASTPEMLNNLQPGV